MPWPEVLAEMEGRIEAAQRVLREGGKPSAPYHPPDGLGPLPVELTERARRIQADTARVAAQVGAARDRVAAALCRPAERPSQAPSYIDARL